MITNKRTLKFLYENTTAVWILGPITKEIDVLDLTTELSDISDSIKIKIAPYAFKDCNKLTEVKIGPNVTFIGAYAFADCEQLKTVAITASQPAGTLNIVPELVIDYGAFKGTQSLETLSLPFIGNTRKASIGKQHFGYIFGAPHAEIQNDYIPAGLTEISFTGTTIVQNEADSEVLYTAFELYKKSFYGCSNIKIIKIVRPTWNTTSLRSIPDDCFNSCISLSYFGDDTNNTQSNTVDLMSNDGSGAELVGSHIGERAFYNCTQIYKINLSKLNIDVTTKGTPRVGVDAFKNCYNLVQITGPGVDNLQHAELGSTFNGYLTYYAAEVSSTPTGTFKTDTGIILLNKTPDPVNFTCDANKTSLEFPAAANIYVNKYAFNNCPELTAIEFNSDASIKELYIGDNAFCDCKKLNTVTIPEVPSIYIGAQTFNGSSVKYINHGTIGPKEALMSWCTNITFGVYPQLFSSNTEVVSFFDGLMGNDDFISIDKWTQDNIFTIPAYAFYNLQPKDKNYEIRLTSSNASQLLIDIGAFENSNVKLVLGDNIDIADIKPNAFANHTASFNYIAGNTNPAQSEVVLDYYTLGSWLTRVDWPSTFDISQFAGSSEIQVICKIPGNIKHICTDVFKAVNAKAVELYNTEQIPIKFRVEYASNSFDTWYTIDFKNEWSNPMYQEAQSLSNVSLAKDFYLVYADGETTKETQIKTVNLSNKKPSSFSLSGFTFDTVITNADTVLDYTVFKNTNILAAEIVPQSAAYIANKNLIALKLTGNGFITDNAFANCPALQEVTIAQTINAIGADAFLNCSSISRVNYSGTLAQWCNMVFATTYSNPLSAGTPAFYCDNKLVENNIYIDTDVLNKFTLNNIAAITSITFTKALTRIDPQCILRCGSLRDITAPDTSINSNIKIDHSNIYLANTAIVLLDYENILNTTEVIATGACSCGINNITKICIPTCVNTIEAGAIDKNFLTKLSNAAAETPADAYGQTADTTFKVELPFLGRTRTDTPTKYLGYTFGILNNAIGSGLSEIAITDDNILTSQAFAGCAELKQVILSPNLCIVEPGAFSGCELQHKDGYLLDTDGKNRLLYKLPPNVEVLNITCPVYDKAAYNHAEIETLIFDEAPLEFSIGLNAFALTAVKSVNIGNTTKVTINERAFYKCNSLEDVKLENVGLLGAEAFYGCTKLETLQLPKNIDVSKLGARIFSGCTGLKDLKIPAPLTKYVEKRYVENVELLSGTAVNRGAFSGCTSLRSVKLEDTITKIGAQAFYGCSQLREINLDNITTIEDNAFTNCTNLYNAGIIKPQLVENLKSVKNAFTGCYKLVEIRTTGNYTLAEAPEASGLFSACRSIIDEDAISNIKVNNDKLVIYDNKVLLDYLGTDPNLSLYGLTIEEIAPFAFINNDTLVTLELTGSTVTIGTMAFYSCNNFVGFAGTMNSLTTIGIGAFSTTAIEDTAKVLGGNITTIPERAFENCKKLTTISLSATIEKVASDAFIQCNNITDITVDADNNFYTAVAEDNVLPAVLSKDGKQLVFGFFTAQSSDSVNLNSNISEILDGAFKNQTATINCLNLPSGLKRIGVSAFEGCSHLKSINFNFPTDSDTRCIIAVSAFKGCDIRQLAIPGNIKKIESEAFMNNKELKTITFAAGITDLGPKAFMGCKLNAVTLPSTLGTVGSFVFANNPANLELTAPDNTATDDANDTVLVTGYWKHKWNATSVTNATNYNTYTTKYE